MIKWDVNNLNAPWKWRYILTSYAVNNMVNKGVDQTVLETIRMLNNHSLNVVFTNIEKKIEVFVKTINLLNSNYICNLTIIWRYFCINVHQIDTLLTLYVRGSTTSILSLNFTVSKIQKLEHHQFRKVLGASYTYEH